MEGIYTVMPQDDLRGTLLAVIADQQRQHDGSLQSGPVLMAVRNRLGNIRGLEFEQGLLTAFSDLFRTGYLAWGLDISNTNLPFFPTI